MPIIAVSNQKGGVGKTTTTLNLGAALREAGKRVLLVDLDPQGNLTVACGVEDVDSAYPAIGDLLMLAARGKPVKGPTIADAVIHSPSGLDVVPSNGSLSAAELGLVSAMNREAALASTLKPIVDQYDYVLIDCLPSLGLLAINAMRAANGVVVPVQADFLAMQGLAQIIETIAAVREQLNPDLAIYGVLLTMVDPRTTHSRDVVRSVRETLEGQVHVFETEVRLHVVLKETAKAGRSILDFDGSSPSAEAYRQLAHEVMSVVGDAPSAEARHTARAAAQTPVAPEAAPAQPEPAGVVSAPAVVHAVTVSPANGQGTSALSAPAVAEQPPPESEPDGLAVVPEPPATSQRTLEPILFEHFLEGRERWLGSVSR